MADDSASARPPVIAFGTAGTPRRTFIARLAAAVAALSSVARHLVSPPAARAAAASSPPPTQPNAALLAALGSAVLPAELGADGTQRAVADFQRWMDGYRPGAEANHGYGTGTIQTLPGDPRPRWRAQLLAFDEEAGRRHRTAFASLSRADRQTLVRTALAGVRVEALPTPLAAQHVALALLAHFYDSPAATDLCYEAAIGRQQCRPLSAGRQQPVPLTRRAP